MPQVAAPSPITLRPMVQSSSMNIQQPLGSPASTTAPTAAAQPRQVLNQSSFSFQLTGPPPPGARAPAPTMRRGSRFDPMEITAEEEAPDELGPRHPLRRIREDLPPERSNSEGNVSLPGIKALLNAADQPPLVSPFAPSFSPSIHSATSPLDSPTSRTSRFSSFASSVGDSPGWWAPDERRDSLSAGYPSRSGSFSRGPLNEEPDLKRRRSDLAPTLPDADEVARLKWQAQSRNASFPASGSISAGSGLRAMLYPPMSSSSSMSRGSFSATPLGSPLSPPVESPRDYASSRGSPMTGPLARSFAELTASERSPGEGRTPSRNRSPVERRPSLFLQSTRSNESIPTLPPPRDTGSLPSPVGLGASDPASQRLPLTRPSSPEPPTSRRGSSLAELIKASSGDDIALAKGFFTQTSPVGPNVPQPSDAPVPWINRRASTESVQSTNSVSVGPLDDIGGGVPRDRRGAAVMVQEPRRFDDVEMDPKSDPMRGMEVLAESARRVADAERKDSHEDREPSPTKPSASSTGPKYTCQFCAKTFSRPSSLRIHTYSHTGERPFVCKEPSCRRRFSVQSNLKRHAKVHQLQAQQAQAAAAQINQRAPLQPPRHPMHMGPGGHGPQGAPVYGYPPHPGAPPPHLNMMHHAPPPPPGYGPPPHGFMPGGRPAFDPAHGPPHFQPPGVRPGPPGDHMAAHYHGMPRRHSHEVDPGTIRPGGGGGHRAEEWGSEEEVDELDDDE